MSALVNPSHVVIHTAATPNRSTDISAASIRAYHVNEKGWADIGYHWVVRFNGSIEEGRPEKRVGAHVDGLNSKAIGVCFSGNGDLTDFTKAQKEAGAAHVADILRRHHLVDEFLRNPMRVLGHRECNLLIPSVFAGPRTTKSCPGKLVDCAEFRRLVIRELDH